MLTLNEINTFRSNARYTRYQCIKLTPPKFMQPTSRCLKLMKSYEQLRSQPYDDQTGRSTSHYCPGATVGYGHLIKNRNEFETYRHGINEFTASLLFESDLYKYIQGVKMEVLVDLTQNEFDALVMMAFNIGKNAFKQSTILRIINGANTRNLRDAWNQFRYSQGRVMRGLINRRTCEMNIFLTGCI
ncbi:lysozyme, partial [Citrobacter sp. Awk 4]|uniref:lysozyme n=1 Tax=Citrobacter sp. Awk 4 TaxID=2963955 RepID=UPI0023030F83